MFILQFFFWVWQIITQDKCFEPLKRNEWNIFDGTLPFSCKKIRKKFWPVQLLENAPMYCWNDFSNKYYMVEIHWVHSTFNNKICFKNFCQTLELWGQYRPITEGLTEGWMENPSDIISDRLNLDWGTAERLTWASETDRKSLSWALLTYEQNCTNKQTDTEWKYDTGSRMHKEKKKFI